MNTIYKIAHLNLKEKTYVYIFNKLDPLLLTYGLSEIIKKGEMVPETSYFSANCYQFA